MERAEARRLYEQLTEERNRAFEQLTEAMGRHAGLIKALAGLAQAFPGIEDEVEPAETNVVVEGQSEAVLLAALQAQMVHRQLTAQAEPRSIPEGLELIFRRDAGNTWFSTSELVMELEVNGWLGDSSDPDAAVRAALRRMRDRGVVQSRNADGRTLEYTLLADASGAADDGFERLRLHALDLPRPGVTSGLQPALRRWLINQPHRDPKM